MNRFALINTASDDYCVHMVIETNADWRTVLKAYEMGREKIEDDGVTEYWDLLEFATPFDFAIDFLERNGYLVKVEENIEELYMEW